MRAEYGLGGASPSTASCSERAGWRGRAVAALAGRRDRGGRVARRGRSLRGVTERAGGTVSSWSAARTLLGSVRFRAERRSTAVEAAAREAGRAASAVSGLGWRKGRRHAKSWRTAQVGPSIRSLCWLGACWGLVVWAGPGTRGHHRQGSVAVGLALSGLEPIDGVAHHLATCRWFVAPAMLVPRAQPRERGGAWRNCHMSGLEANCNGNVCGARRASVPLHEASSMVSPVAGGGRRNLDMSVGFPWECGIRGCSGLVFRTVRLVRPRG